MIARDLRLDRPGDGEIHLWWFDLPSDKFTGRALAQRKTREVLSLYLGVAPAGVRFERGRRGKPLLVALDRLSFNLSHGGGKGLVAVAAGPRIGVDIEAIRKIDPLGLAGRFFSPGEAEGIAAQAEPVSAFFRVWVRKEAYLKALGGAVPSCLPRFSVSVGEKDPRILATELELGGSRFSLVDIDPPAGYLAAVAVEGEVNGIVLLGLDGTPGGT